MRLIVPGSSVCVVQIESSIFWLEPRVRLPMGVMVLALGHSPRFMAAAPSEALEAGFRALVAGLRRFDEGECDVFTLAPLVTERVEWDSRGAQLRVTMNAALWAFARPEAMETLGCTMSQELSRRYLERALCPYLEAFFLRGAPRLDEPEGMAAAIDEGYERFHEGLPMEPLQRRLELMLAEGFDPCEAYVTTAKRLDDESSVLIRAMTSGNPAGIDESSRDG